MEMMSPNLYKERNREKSLNELLSLKEQLKNDIEKLSQVDDNNSVLTSDTRLQMKQAYLAEISNLIEEKETQSTDLYKVNKQEINNLKKLVEEVIGNNDPFWNIPVYETVKKIVDLPDGTETSITKLLKNSQFTSKQLFDIYNCVNRVCRKLDIVLDFSRENAKVDGLLYNLPFVIRHNKSSEKFTVQNGEFQQINSDENLKGKKVETYEEWED